MAAVDASPASLTLTLDALAQTSAQLSSLLERLRRQLGQEPSQGAAAARPGSLSPCRASEAKAEASESAGGSSSRVFAAVASRAAMQSANSMNLSGKCSGKHHVPAIRDFLEASSGMELTEDDVQHVFELGRARTSVCSHNSVGNQSDSFQLLHPHCRFRLFHDLVSTVALVYDAVSLPMIFAWDLPMEGGLRAAAACLLIFWTWDIVMNFFTGRMVGGHEVRAWRPVVKHYLRTLFILDLTIVVVDFTSLMGLAVTRHVAMFRFFKFMRTSHILRFYRAGTLVKLLRKNIPVFVYERLCFAGSVFLPLLLVVIMNHWLACIWFAVGMYAPSDTGDSWLRAPSREDLRGDFLWYQYTTCFHWSLAQMTPGTVEVHPRNSSERVLSILCLLGGMLIFSSIISGLSTKINEQRVRDRAKRLTLQDLHEFLRVNSVDSQVHFRVVDAAEDIFKRRDAKPKVMGDLGIVRELPTSLQLQLHQELYSQRLAGPLFAVWRVLDPELLETVCQEAVSSVAYMAGDAVFTKSTRSHGAQLIAQGGVSYSHERERERELEVGMMMCELALWLKWVHRGKAVAACGCVLLKIDAEKFGSIAICESGLGRFFLEFGRASAQWARENAFLLSDIVAWRTEHRLKEHACLMDLVLPRMSAPARLVVCRAALLHGRKGRRDGDRHGADLELQRVQDEEVPSGRCCLTVDGQGGLCRIVCVHVVEIERMGSEKLMQVATVKNGVTKVSFQRPGARLLGGEAGAEAVAKVLGGMLAPFARHLVWEGADVEVSLQVSGRVNVPTKYIRTVNKASLHFGADEEVGLEAVEVSHVRGQASVVGDRNVGRRGSGNSDLLPPFYALAGYDDEIGIFAWLSESECRHFNSSRGQQELQEYFRHFSLSLALVESANAFREKALSSQAAAVSSGDEPSGSSGSSAELDQAEEGDHLSSGGFTI